MITLIYHVPTFFDLKQMKDFFFLSKSRSGPKWAPTVGSTFKLIPQPRLF